MAIICFGFIRCVVSETCYSKLNSLFKRLDGDDIDHSDHGVPDKVLVPDRFQ
jgi:hypothetical protein